MPNRKTDEISVNLNQFELARFDVTSASQAFAVTEDSVGWINGGIGQSRVSAMARSSF